MTAEQLKMPPVTCDKCGQPWPYGPAEATEHKTIESAPIVATMPDGSIVTSQTIVTIEPPTETGEQS